MTNLPIANKYLIFDGEIFMSLIIIL